MPLARIQHKNEDEYADGKNEKEALVEPVEDQGEDERGQCDGEQETDFEVPQERYKDGPNVQQQDGDIGNVREVLLNPRAVHGQAVIQQEEQAQHKTRTQDVAVVVGKLKDKAQDGNDDSHHHVEQTERAELFPSQSFLESREQHDLSGVNLTEIILPERMRTCKIRRSRQPRVPARNTPNPRR